MNNFGMELGARTKDWVDTTVETNWSKCGKVHNTVPVEGKTKADGSDGIAHTENLQEKGDKAQEMLEEVDKEMEDSYVNEQNSGHESQGLKD